MSLYPLVLEAALHVKVWGGRRLETKLNKTLPTDEPYGESWEVHESCVVRNGQHSEKTVHDLIQTYGTELIGPHNDPSDGLPLLAKFIDAEKWLSVQVHPDDALAEALEGQPRGKTEAHYIIEIEGDAQFVIGLKDEATPDSIREAITANTFHEQFVYEHVVPGQVLYMEAGTVHAIGPGVLLYEIQQSSDTTYRFYDWGRVGLDGNPRELHIEKAIRASRIGSLPPMKHTATDTAQRVELVNEAYFKTNLFQLTADTNQASLDTQQTHFHILSCTAGTIKIETQNHNTVTLAVGESALMPACIGTYTLSGVGKILQSQQP